MAARKSTLITYPHLLFLVVIIFLFIIFVHTTQFAIFIALIKDFGFVGACIIGFFFVSSFTVVPATYMLIQLAATFGIVGTALGAGLGATLGDLLLFDFLRGRFFDELICIGQRLKIRTPHLFLTHSARTYLYPIIGAIIIASPLPDELGIALMGISKLKKWQFLVLTFVLNTIGIGLLLLLLV